MKTTVYNAIGDADKAYKMAAEITSMIEGCSGKSDRNGSDWLDRVGKYFDALNGVEFGVFKVVMESCTINIKVYMDTEIEFMVAPVEFIVEQMKETELPDNKEVAVKKCNSYYDIERGKFCIAENTVAHYKLSDQNYKTWETSNK